MATRVLFVIASFTAPAEFGTNWRLLLWLLLLAAAITVVYKATKLPRISAGNFIKEVAVSFGSGIVLLILIAVALYVLAWLITG